MAAKKKAKVKPRAKPKAVAKSGNNQDMIIGVIVIIVIIAIIALLMFQGQIMGTETGLDTSCQEEVYYETVTSTKTTQQSVPFEYNILDKADWIEQGYPSYGTIAKYSYTIENLEEENGTFTLACSVRTTENGTTNKSESELIIASNPTAIIVEFTISPGEGTEFPGCTVTAPSKVSEVTEDVTEQVRKTRLPAGCSSPAQ